MPKLGEKLDHPSSRAPLATKRVRELHAALTCAGHTVGILAAFCGCHHTTAGRWLYGVQPSRHHAKIIVAYYSKYGITMALLGYGDDQ